MGPYRKTFSQGPFLCFSFFTTKSHIERIKIKVASVCEREVIGPPDLIAQIDAWLLAYFDKRALPTLPLSYPKLTAFQMDILQNLMSIPQGKTWSYQKLAEFSNYPKASRAVGSVCKNNHFPLVIPCHRVIRADSSLGNYNGGQEIKKRLLAFEGASFS